jgi:hypothetical protein
MLNDMTGIPCFYMPIFNSSITGTGIVVRYQIFVVIEAALSFVGGNWVFSKRFAVVVIELEMHMQLLM